MSAYKFGRKAHMTYFPFKFLDFSSNNDLALVLLNQKWVSFQESNVAFLELFKKLWKKAKLTASVDGATNNLHYLNERLNLGYVPSLISGDFDSVNPDLISLYRSKGSEIIETPDQNYTDFTKCLKIFSEKYSAISSLKTITDVVCLIGKSDRFDHVMSNINTLFTCKSFLSSDIHICLLSQDGFASVLQSGKTYVNATPYLQFKAPKWCSFSPIESPVIITTAGLKHNLNKKVLKVGYMIPSQNEILDITRFSIESDKPIVLMLPIQF